VDADSLDLAFAGELIFWRGPSPHYFVVVPEEPSALIRAVSTTVTYGWGAIPVRVRLRDHTWSTSLFPKDGRYLVPIRKAVRLAEGLAEGDVVDLELVIRA
jgi:Domain of unknown function (DUF1905)